MLWKEIEGLPIGDDHEGDSRIQMKRNLLIMYLRGNRSNKMTFGKSLILL